MKRIGMLLYMCLALLDFRFDLARFDWWCHRMEDLSFLWPAYDGEDNLRDWWNANYTN